MDDREDLVYQAKLAEQAERYDGELWGQRGAGILGPSAAAHRGRERETKWRHCPRAWPGGLGSGSGTWPGSSRSDGRPCAPECDPFAVLSRTHLAGREAGAEELVVKWRLGGGRVPGRGRGRRWRARPWNRPPPGKLPGRPWEVENDWVG
ncbi:hypothetical protein P7K49_010291 [Saguinus oedipus]|uniref:Uncharacterized protein n=1 Tax=Saguinus oedipus TaxID=9490 RepID=A0ABQ9VMZ8_SAGOE|nr:hypothetical protein P7K49_010291 [Saguinus oedipus]